MDQLTLAIATALASKGAEAVGAGARSGISALFRLVRARFGDGTRESATLTAAVEHPDERWRLVELASALADVMARDRAFAAAVRSGWHRASESQPSVGPAETINHFSGTATTVVQAHDVRGGISL